MASSVPEVFGIPIQGGSLETILTWAFDPSLPTPKWIVTANPEILLEAKRNPAYATVLRQAEYLCVDGTGLLLALRASGHDAQRVTGVALAEALIARAAQEGLRVGFVGGDPGVAKAVATHWLQRFSSLQIVAEEAGKILPDGTADLAEEEAVHRLVLAAPDVLLVAFGGGTKQESWIARRLADLPSVKIVVGVGGAFDFWTDRIKRAPAFLQKIGLEWLWRLVQEPRRLKRIVRATILFPIAYVIDQLRQSGPARKRWLYIGTLVLRVLFFFFILCPALYRYLWLISLQGVRRYPWGAVDLIVPFVILVVLYPVFRFIKQLVAHTP